VLLLMLLQTRGVQHATVQGLKQLLCLQRIPQLLLLLLHILAELIQL
jgi:hypothetical protein